MSSFKRPESKYFAWILVVVILSGVIIEIQSNFGGRASGASQNVSLYQSSFICGTSRKLQCKVGEIGPGGGTIFFVDYDNIYPGFNFLEAAPAGWFGPGTPDDPALTWCSDTSNTLEKSLTIWGNRAIGQGQTNTATMNATCTSGAAFEVKKFNASNRNRYSDWFLPSLGELILLTQNMQGLGDLLASDYWSSSEYSDLGGWVQSVGHGYQGSASKTTTFKVRPIRSF